MSCSVPQAALLPGVHFEFHLLGGDDALAAAGFGAEAPGDGTPVPAGADDQRRRETAVDDPARADAFDGADGFAEPEPGAAAAQQEMIELAAAHGEAHGSVVAGLDHRPADDAGAKAGQGLEDVVAAVGLAVDVQVGQDLGRDPAGAHLVAREGRFVENQDIEAEPAERQRTTGARRAAPDDQDVGVVAPGPGAAAPAPGRPVAAVRRRHSRRPRRPLRTGAPGSSGSRNRRSPC